MKPSPRFANDMAANNSNLVPNSYPSPALEKEIKITAESKIIDQKKGRRIPMPAQSSLVNQD